MGSELELLMAKLADIKLQETPCSGRGEAVLAEAPGATQGPRLSAPSLLAPCLPVPQQLFLRRSPGPWSLCGPAASPLQASRTLNGEGGARALRLFLSESLDTPHANLLASFL